MHNLSWYFLTIVLPAYEFHVLSFASLLGRSRVVCVHLVRTDVVENKGFHTPEDALATIATGLFEISEQPTLLAIK